MSGNGVAGHGNRVATIPCGGWSPLWSWVLFPTFLFCFSPQPHHMHAMVWSVWRKAVSQGAIQRDKPIFFASFCSGG